MVKEKLLLTVSVMFRWLVGCYYSFPAAPLVVGIDQVDYNQTFSATIRATTLLFHDVKNVYVFVCTSFEIWP